MATRIPRVGHVDASGPDVDHDETSIRIGLIPVQEDLQARHSSPAAAGVDDVGPFMPHARETFQAGFGPVEGVFALRSEPLLLGAGTGETGETEDLDHRHDHCGPRTSSPAALRVSDWSHEVPYFHDSLVPSIPKVQGGFWCR